jgi:hypothetical protein
MGQTGTMTGRPVLRLALPLEAEWPTITLDSASYEDQQRLALWLKSSNARERLAGALEELADELRELE